MSAVGAGDPWAADDGNFRVHIEQADQVLGFS